VRKGCAPRPARAQPFTERSGPMRGSGLVWTIVGALLVVALLLFILPRL
jgi:hypothetical protein